MKKFLNATLLLLVALSLNSCLAGKFMCNYALKPAPHGVDDIERTRYKADSLLAGSTAWYDNLKAQGILKDIYADGFNGKKDPNAQVTFNQFGFYAQDEWNATDKLKLTYGVRFDNLTFDESDLARNNAIYALTFRDGQKVDTGKWPDSRLQISPRLGFTYDVFGDKSLKVRGGTGIFTGRLPLVFFTNMPTNANMVQNSITYTTTYKNGVPTGEYNPNLDKFVGGMITNIDEMITKLGLPTELNESNHQTSRCRSSGSRPSPLTIRYLYRSPSP